MKRASFVALLLLSCTPKQAPTEAAPTEAAPTEEQTTEPSLAETVLGDMDLQADPCEDFYQYACGSWLERTELPADKPAWTRSFSEIAERNRAYLRDLLERAAADPSAGDADWKKMGDYYGTCMDTEAADAAGIQGIQPVLDDIDGLSDKAGLMALVGELQLIGVDALYSMEVEGDFKDPQQTILHLSQGGLGLPDRDYYLKDDEESKQLLVDYQAHIAELLSLSGVDPDLAAKQAEAIVGFEHALAESHWPVEELRDPQKTYNRLDRDGLDELTPELDWGAALAAMGVPDAQQINVATPDVIKALQGLVADTDLDTLKAYLRWHTLSAMAPAMSEAFVNADFDFYGKKVWGQQEIEPRWKRCVRSTDGAMGFIMAKFYVKDRFGGDSKSIAIDLVHAIEDSFEAGLADLSWMDDATREAAIAKKNALGNQVGYPDEWRDYSALEVIPGDNVANVLAARRFESHRLLSHIGKPHDPSDWFMSPPTVNAYYHPLFNEMVFPAGILQPPFFDAKAPSAMNFGGIGMVMGHELTHGFDDQGRQFDAHGHMQPWWSDESVERFEKQASCVEEQFDAFEPLPGLHVNGKLTLGENLADLGGVRTSYRAWKTWRKDHGETGNSVEGLTEDQLFFVSFAQGWCTVASPEYEKLLVTSNPHSPAKYRVNAPLSNSPGFHEAFSCEEGTPMHPKDYCEVW